MIAIWKHLFILRGVEIKFLFQIRVKDGCFIFQRLILCKISGRSSELIQFSTNILALARQILHVIIQ
jgi:hypothetical protein